MKIEIERDVLQQALELAQAFARGHDDGWQSAMGHQAAHYKPYGYLYEGIAEHTRGKTLFKKIPETHLETRWWREVGPIYTSPQPAPQQKPDASKQWEPEFDAICPKQEALAKQFCEDIAQTHGGLMDPVRLLEMAEALYCAERDESIDSGSSDVVESVARNINAGHDGKYCSDLWPVTADAIRNFVGSDFCSLKFGREDQSPDENDQYLMSAHDLISAFRSWKDFELQLVTQQTPDALHLAAMDLARKQAQRIAELESEIAGLESGASHMSIIIDELRSLLVEVDDVFGKDGYGFPFEDGDSALIDRIRSRIESIAEPAPQLAARVPLTDDQIKDLCKVPWVFDTARQWVRIIEAAHGITKGV